MVLEEFVLGISNLINCLEKNAILQQVIEAIRNCLQQITQQEISKFEEIVKASFKKYNMKQNEQCNEL